MKKGINDQRVSTLKKIILGNKKLNDSCVTQVNELFIRYRNPMLNLWMFVGKGMSYMNEMI